MKQVTPELIHALANSVRQHPVIVRWLGEWRMSELERLPSVGPQTVTLAQGRCQVLGELYKLMSESPDLAAEPRKGS
jgi:hypothetical protein